MSEGKRRELIAVITNTADLAAAIEELERSGFRRPDINVVAAKKVIDRHLAGGHAMVTEGGSEDAETRISKVSRERLLEGQTMLASILTVLGASAAAGGIVASGGALAGVVAAAAAGGGASAALGAGLAALIGKEHAEHLRRRIEEGDMLLSVRVPHEEAENRAAELLLKHTSEELNMLALSESGARS